MFKQTKSANSVLTADGGTTTIGEGATITGDLECQGDLRIDGTVIGNISAKAKVIIGPTGFVAGDLNGEQADIQGKVEGKIKMEGLLQIRGKASIQGDIYTGKLQLEPTATFNGLCYMGEETVESKNRKSLHAATEA